MVPLNSKAAFSYFFFVAFLSLVNWSRSSCAVVERIERAVSNRAAGGGSVSRPGFVSSELAITTGELSRDVGGSSFFWPQPATAVAAIAPNRATQNRRVERPIIGAVS